MRTIGAITIGRAPRDDVVPEMEKLLDPGVRVLQAGALDGLSRADIAALAPADGQEALITRLADGSEVIVARPALPQPAPGAPARAPHRPVSGGELA